MPNKKKQNPRRIPKTQADVDHAFARGQDVGAKGALIIMLYALLDKHGATEDELKEFSRSFNYTLDAVNQGYVTMADLQ